MVQISSLVVLLGVLFGMAMASPIALESQPRLAKRIPEGYEYKTSATQTTPAQGKYLVRPSQRPCPPNASSGCRCTRHVLKATTRTPVGRGGSNSDCDPSPQEEIIDHVIALLTSGFPPGQLPSSLNPLGLPIPIPTPKVNGDSSSSSSGITQLKDEAGSDGSRTRFLLTDSKPPNSNTPSSAGVSPAGLGLGVLQH
ncbi:hypothetical protein BDN72DRAFT_860089 [Pluteus cervinus]|uniref:Uncharacterized protein n=1 Tax=Pluteus cervinus TaxID=181527 RepID=A0ACD3AKY2_9AGAR|nr:hypothetical protein BDN72DRAFT_860089 [Pluteus cervinus]